MSHDPRSELNQVINHRLFSRKRFNQQYFQIINGTRQVTYFFGPTFYGQLLGISNQGLF